MTQTYLSSQLSKRLHEIGKDADSRTAEIEDLRRLPDDIAQALKDSGVLRLWTAKEYGGHEAHINAMLDATETLSYYDGSTGWVAMVTGTASLTSGFMQPEAGQRIFGDAGSMVGGLAAPMGMAQQVDGGLRVSGKWFWGSGTPFCTTIIGLAGVVDAEGKPSKLDNGVKLPLLFFKPGDVTLHDTWHVSGLKGTASGEYTVQDVFVPDGDWVAFPPVTPVLDRTLYRFPYTGALAAGVASAALGMARRALDEILVQKRTIGQHVPFCVKRSHKFGQRWKQARHRWSHGVCCGWRQRTRLSRRRRQLIRHIIWVQARRSGHLCRSSACFGMCMWQLSMRLCRRICMSFSVEWLSISRLIRLCFKQTVANRD